VANKIKRFEDLEVWRLAINLAVDIYKIAESGKLNKDFDAKSQIRRAAFSISSNIAEGFEYNSTSEFIRFLKYAKGSAGEVRNQLTILFRVEYLSKTEYEKLTNQVVQVSQQISNFMKYLKEFKKKTD
jgi:four helix bundle protein